MFGHRYLGDHFFGGRYFGDGGSSAPPGATAAQIWSYVLSNGKTAGQNLVENNTLLRYIAAVAAGKTSITDTGGGTAIVRFRDIYDTEDLIEADMVGSERVNVTLDPS